MEEDNGKKTMVDSGNLFLAFINTHEMIQNKPYNPFTRLFSVTIVTCNLNSATLQ
jgi:hypothetical protein